MTKPKISPQIYLTDVTGQSQTLFPLDAKRQVPHGSNETPKRSRFTAKTFTIPFLSAEAVIYIHTSMHLDHNTLSTTTNPDLSEQLKTEEKKNMH